MANGHLSGEIIELKNELSEVSLHCTRYAPYALGDEYEAYFVEDTHVDEDYLLRAEEIEYGV